jgi:Glycosyl transferase family 2
MDQSGMVATIVDICVGKTMPPRPIKDPTKARAAAMTMVRGDHFFLRRWLDYYGAQVGREHLYVLSHGNDPEIRRIAEGANVIHVPYDESRTKVEAKRWAIQSHFTNGLLRYYNWVICGDVDEMVVVDPDVAPGLLDYLDQFAPRATPAVVCPLGIEIIHNPALEPEPMEDGVPILSRRRIFRLNANYSKPCITRIPLTFSPGGHSCTHHDRTVDPHLFLMHLRFVSHDLTLARLQSRKAMKLREAETVGAEVIRRPIWEKDAESYLELSKKEPVAETVEFADFRRIMVEQKKSVEPGGHWFFGGGRSKDLYRLPQRFAGLF